MLNLDLPYTRAVVQKGYRIRPVGPLSIPRKTTKDATVLRHHIPKNTMVIEIFENHIKRKYIVNISNKVNTKIERIFC